MPNHRKHKLDAADFDSLEMVTRSRGWQLIQQRINGEIGRKLTALEQPQAELETARLRGFLAGLRTALAIPDLLMNEGDKNGADAG